MQEFRDFIEYGLILSKMYAWDEAHSEVGSVEVPMRLQNHSGKVGEYDEKWTIFIPQTETNKVLQVAETGEVTARLTPKQMPLPFSEDFSIVNNVTGEVVNG